MIALLNTEWDRELAAGLTSVAEAKTREDARTSIPQLLAKLGDLYTRWLPAKQYQDFRIGNDGQLQGVGMLIASDPQSGRLVVLAPIKGSPADQAGIQPGDEVRSMLQCRLLAGSQQACLPACPCRNEETAASPSVSPSASLSANLTAPPCSW